MEVTKPWSNYNTNKYYIITRDKETNEWKFFKEIVGHTVLWKDEPSSRYGMTKSRAIEVLNIVKNLTNEDVETEAPTEPNPTEGEGETSGPTTPTTPTDGEPTTPTDTDPTDTPTEPSEGDNGTPTNTDGETSTGENESGETPSTGDTEPNTEPENGNGTNTEPTDPETHVEEPDTPVTEPQYKIITISSVTYNSTEATIFDDDDYNKLRSTLLYIDTTYPNTNVHVITVETDNTGKSIFYFYLDDELTWFLELRTNIDYSLVNHVTTLDDIKKLL